MTGFGAGLTARVVTASDRAAAGEYTDRSGPVAVDALRAWGFDVSDAAVVPDGDPVGAAVRDALAAGAAVVLTTGGTGVTARDRTPEVTAPLLDRDLPGVAEALRAEGVAKGVPTAVLSRGVAGIAGDAVVVNLPGSTGGVRDGIEVLGRVLPHLLGELGHDTGRGGHVDGTPAGGPDGGAR